MKNCVVCGSNDLVIRDFGLITCRSCGHVMSPLITQPGVMELMDKAYFEEGYSERFNDVWNNFYEYLKAAKVYRYLGPYFPKKKVMEIGVGSGYLLNFLKTRGYKCIGLDLSNDVRESVKERYGIEVLASDIKDIEEKFDNIVLSHVLEHISDPRAFLEYIKPRLTDDGILYIAVPNGKGFSAIFKSWPNYVPYHLSYFNKNSIHRLLDDLGFEVDKLITRETITSSQNLLLSAVFRNKNFDIINPRLRDYSYRKDFLSRNILKFVLHFMSNVFGILIYPYRYVLGKLGFGDELIIVAKVK